MRKNRGILERMLEEVFREENDALIARAMEHLKNAGAPEYSEVHLQQIAQLKQMGKKRERQYFYFGARAASRAAVVAGAILAGAVGGVTAYGINYLRTPRIELMQEGMYLYYDLTEEERESLPDKIEECYAPSWLPKGYELCQESRLRMMYMVIYQKEEKQIKLTQSPITLTSATFDTEGVELQKKEVHGYNAYYYEKNGFACLIWCDGEYQFSLIVPEEESDSIMKIAKSLKENPLE